MNPILFEKHLFVFLFAETVIWGMLLWIALVALILLVRWDFAQATPQQFRLEKRSDLVTTVAVVVGVFKLLLFPYFVFTIDRLSGVVPGAMCAAGVISFNTWGMKLLVLKLAVLYALLSWMVLNHNDLQGMRYPFFRAKMALMIGVFLLVSVEGGLDFLFFSGIDIHQVVNCCSTLYGLLEGMNPLPFGLDIPLLLTLFYLLYLTILSAHLGHTDVILIPALGLFGYLGYYAVVYFFGTYIYEDPSHNCPFCMLQRDYGYVGYLVWGTLFGGTFAGMAAVLDERLSKRRSVGWRRLMVGLLTLFVLLTTAYVLLYRLRNGVWLAPDTGDGMAGMMM